MAGATADIEHRRRGRRQMVQELLMHHVRAHGPFHRRISIIGKPVGQTGPDVLAHFTNIRGSGWHSGKTKGHSSMTQLMWPLTQQHLRCSANDSSR